MMIEKGAQLRKCRHRSRLAGLLLVFACAVGLSCDSGFFGEQSRARERREQFGIWYAKDLPPELPDFHSISGITCSHSQDELVVDYGSGQLVFRRIPAGSYEVDLYRLHDDGTSGTAVIELSYDFYFATSHVTREMWWALSMTQEHPPDPHLPVYNVNAYAGDRLGAALTVACGVEDLVFRLPTEAEWMRVAYLDYCDGLPCSEGARADLDSVAWHRESSGRVSNGPNPVCRKQPNSLGVCDMVGNAFDFCLDWLELVDGDEFYDPIGDIVYDSYGDELRTIRGGNWATANPSYYDRGQVMPRITTGLYASIRLVAIDRRVAPDYSDRQVLDVPLDDQWKRKVDIWTGTGMWPE